MTWRVTLAAWVLMFAAYTVMFAGFGGSAPFAALQRAAINTVPAALLAWPLFKLIEATLVDARWLRQGIAHFGVAIGFSLLWYIGVQVGYGLRSGWVDGGIIGRPLLGLALAWQLFQGVTLYAAIASFTYAVVYHRRWDALRSRPADVPDNAQTARQLFLKDGKAIRPTALEDVILMSGSGDYTEVLTRTGRFLSGSSLGQFEEELPANDFLRVHRSHIVRLGAVLSVESAGNGRLTLHLPHGHSVETSRAGAKRVRDRAL